MNIHQYKTKQEIHTIGVRVQWFISADSNSVLTRHQTNVRDRHSLTRIIGFFVSRVLLRRGEAGSSATAAAVEK